MFSELMNINSKPRQFEFYDSEVLWNTPHISKKMLEFHLDAEVNSASRKKLFIERSIAWMQSYFSVKDGTRICDFGCGPGLYTLGFAQLGASVTGVDFSQNSIEYAKKIAVEEQIRINYVLDNYLDYETDEKFDLITMIMCDFCVLNPAQRRKLLQKFRSLLASGGSVILDAYQLAAFDKRQETAQYEYRLMNGFWSDQEYFGFLNVFKYPDEKVVLDKYTIVEKNREWQVHNWLQYFSLDSFKAEVQECGLEILATFADVAGSSYDENADEFAVVLKAL